MRCGNVCGGEGGGNGPQSVVNFMLLGTPLPSHTLPFASPTALTSHTSQVRTGVLPSTTGSTALGVLVTASLPLLSVTSQAQPEPN